MPDTYELPRLLIPTNSPSPPSSARSPTSPSRSPQFSPKMSAAASNLVISLVAMQGECRVSEGLELHFTHVYRAAVFPVLV